MNYVLAAERFHDRLRNMLAGVDAKLVTALPVIQKGDRLVTICSGVIVPKAALELLDRGINFHGGPPEYPGRDPHHWAVYDGAKVFGITMHKLAAKVDSGDILAVESFPVERHSPAELRAIATERMLEMFRLQAAPIFNGWLPKPTDHRWSNVRRSRKDLLAMLDLRGVGDAEIYRRRAAFYGFPIIENPDEDPDITRTAVGPHATA